MSPRVVVSVVVIGLALGIGLYGVAQNSSLGLNFSPGDILTAADLNAIVAQVDANTAAIESTTAQAGDNTASLNTQRFEATLTGAQEVTDPLGGVDTDATGTIVAEFDAGFTRVDVMLVISNGVGVGRAHFHCGRAGQNGPIVFGLTDPGPLTLTNEGTAGTLTNMDFTGADCSPDTVIGRPVNNIAALAFAMRDGLIYANVHTMANPGGEIRGQMH